MGELSNLHESDMRNGWCEKRRGVMEDFIGANVVSDLETT